MDDAYEVAVDLLGVHDLQITDSLSDAVHSQLVGSIQGRSGGVSTFRILYVGTADEYFPDYGIQGSASLACQELGRLDLVVVDRGPQQHIGQFDVAAILTDDCGHDAHRELLAGGSYAFSQRRESLGQRRVLAELDLFTAILRNRLLLAELVMDQIRFSEIDQIVAVVGLHFIGKTRIRGDVRVVEQVKINLKENHCVSFPGISDQNVIFSPLAALRAISARSFFDNFETSSLIVNALCAAVPFSMGRDPFARILETTFFSVLLAAVAIASFTSSL